MKGNKGESKTNPINVESPAFQDAFATPSNEHLISEKTIEPRKLNFGKSEVIEQLNTPKTNMKPTSIFDMFRSSRKNRENEPAKQKPNILAEPLALEYKPRPEIMTEPKPLKPIASSPTQAPPATAPDFYESPKGREIERELKNLVNKLHQSYRLKKKNRMTYATFKSTITEKLRSLKIGSEHTNIYVKQMWKFYEEIHAADNGIVPA